MAGIEYKELSVHDITEDLLDDFNRYQDVKRHWQNKDGTWTLVNEGYTEDWSKQEKTGRRNILFNILLNGTGHVFGAYESGKLAGFATLMNQKFGSNEQYVQLKYIHVSLEQRHKGIGTNLFAMAVEKAKSIGAEKIYISANDSEDTQAFYLNLGCVDAVEINAEAAANEPYDRQMEYVLD